MLTPRGSSQFLVICLKNSYTLATAWRELAVNV